MCRSVGTGSAGVWAPVVLQQSLWDFVQKVSSSVLCTRQFPTFLLGGTFACLEVRHHSRRVGAAVVASGSAVEVVSPQNTEYGARDSRVALVPLAGATGRRTLAAAAPPLATTILPRRRLSWPPEVRAARGEGGGVAPILLPGGSRWPRPPGPPRTARRRGHPLRRQRLPSPDPAAPRLDLGAARWRRGLVGRGGGGRG
jgi:hypothetical protein